MEHAMNARYMPTKAAARYTGLSISTLNKLRVIGDGPKFVKCGRRVVYEIADLDSWLASLKRNSTSSAVARKR
jgi:predicted DNA-binding transcriptional regulator AlpA